MKYSLWSFSALSWSKIHLILEKMSKSDWDKMCQGVFNRDSNLITVDDVISEIKETNTYSHPNEIWIDSKGEFTILV